MSRSAIFRMSFAVAVVAAVSACAPNDASTAPTSLTGAGGTGTGTGGTSGGGSSTGGSGSGTGGATGGAGGSTGGSGGGTGGTVGSGGSSFVVADGAVSGTAVDLSGTWIAKVQTPGVLSVPTVGNVNANLVVILRLVVTEASGTLNARFDICNMTVVTTPNPNTLTVTFTPAVLATLTTSTSENAPVVHVGDPVPLPSFTILSGITATGASVDADGDTHPGVTIPGNVGGQWPVNVYAGLNVPFSLTGTVTAANALSGTAKFNANGIVFGSDSPFLLSGNIGVTPQPPDVPFSAALLVGDVPCADVVSAFP